MKLYFTIFLGFVLIFYVLCDTVPTSSCSSTNVVSISYPKDRKKIDENKITDEEESEDEEDEMNGEKDQQYSTGTRKERGPKAWDRWSKWSKCSVTCGKGKQTRWRHCVSGACMPGEKEAQIKTCIMHPC